MPLVDERRKLAALLERLEGDPPPSGRELHEIWDHRARPFWRAEPGLYHALARRCREAGENFLAIEVAEEGLAWFDDDLAPAARRQLVHARALAYANVGSGERARELVEELRTDRSGSADALGLLARTHKNWSETAANPAARRNHLLHAREAYREALSHVADPYLAINAATTSLLLATTGGPDAEGYRLEARLLAVRAQKLCGEDEGPEAPPRPDRERARYWRLATLAEASLILGESTLARDHYAAAAAAGRHQRAALLATRRQTRLLLGALRRDPHEFDACFPLSAVGLFTGHMVDLPDRPLPRFPERNVPLVRARIAAALEEHGVFLGYGSAACGADLLFLRAVLDRPGGEVHVVLPFERERFRRESVVRVAAHAAWGEEFDRVLAAATSVTELSDSPCWYEANSFVFGNRVLQGAAEGKARAQGDAPVCFALWDGRSGGDRLGGTADFVAQVAARGRPRILLSPAGEPTRQDNTPAATAPDPRLPIGSASADRDGDGVTEEIVAVLCGEWDSPDAAAGERPALEARKRFFEQAAAALAPYDGEVMHRWVNVAQFRLIFRNLLAAGHGAQALRAGTADGGGTLRLAIHAGPVLRWQHPLLSGGEQPTGVHLQKAARLAALPANGRTYASREYAALLEALPPGPTPRRVQCVYQGSTALGEPFGRQAIFVLATL